MSSRSIARVILFAEDDPNDIALLNRIVTRFFPQHRLEVVPDGVGVLSYLQGHGRYADRDSFPMPQLVLLDIDLPQMNGLKVLAWIRNQPELRGTIVVILTASEDQEDLRTAYALHANSFLHKNPLLHLPNVSKGILEYWLSLNLSL